jgi:eukaryotic-like serine/threonine-protein kinase
VVVPPADDSLPGQGTRAGQAGDRMKPAQGASGPEPDAGQGTLLAGRYRLVERLGEQEGSAEWRATDEMLARTVTVRVFTLESHHVARVMAAARAACRVGDPRLARIFDADDCAEPPFIVTGWPSGRCLADVLTAGPLDPWQAARVIAEAADGLAVAH